MKKTGLIALVTVLAAGLLAWRILSHQTPKGQPPLTYLTNENLANFEAAFNNAADETRMLLLLSPT